MSVTRAGKIILVGKLMEEPKLSYTKHGNALARLRLSTGKKVNTAEGEIELSHTVTVWGRRGEQCAKFLTPGASVYVEGEITKDNETGAQEIFVEEIKFLTMGGKK